jgi:hypothetical protein
MVSVRPAGISGSRLFDPSISTYSRRSNMFYITAALHYGHGIVNQPERLLSPTEN